MTTRFTLRKDLPCTPEVAWELLTDPQHMAHWSTAAIALDAPGADDRPDTVGALRTVTLPGGRVKLREVVECSEFPRRFCYRVYDGGPLLRRHSGEQRIDPTASGCVVTWTVEMDVMPSVLGRVLAQSIRREVRRSLDAAGRIAASLIVEPRNLDRIGRDPASLERLGELTAAANLSRDRQRAIADELAAVDDPKRWFARVYQYVTEEMIVAAADPAALGLEHPDWVLALIPVFHTYFEENLENYRQGVPCEEPWQRAWSTCEESDPKQPALPVMKGLIAGVAAHIEADLPRTLARVHGEEFSDRDLREFRPDYLRLAPIFSVASDRLLADLPRSHKPWWVAPATRIHPQIRDTLIAKTTYDVGRNRLKAFALALDAVDPEPPRKVAT